MKTAQMNRPRIVSEAEWLVARKDLLTREKEFTRQRDALSAARRRLPMGEGRQGICVRRTGRQRDAGRSVRRTQPTDYLSLHARAGMGGRLQKLLVPGRSFRRRELASAASRRDAGGRLARAAGRDQAISEAHGLAFQMGIVARQRLSTSTTTSRSPRKKRRRTRFTTTTKRQSS